MPVGIYCINAELAGYLLRTALSSVVKALCGSVMVYRRKSRSRDINGAFVRALLKYKVQGCTFYSFCLVCASIQVASDQLPSHRTSLDVYLTSYVI